MPSKRKIQSVLTGYIGECYVAYELAKRGIFVQRMSQQNFDYDFITDRGIKIEVKSAKPLYCWNGKKTKKSLGWGWNNTKNGYEYKNGVHHRINIPTDRNCDFFILVGMDHNWKTQKVFIVPKEVIGQRTFFKEPVDRKKKNTYAKFHLSDYENKWELITLFSTYTK